MRLINADELMEHVWRDKLDSRELIAKMVENAPTVKEIPTRIPLEVWERLVSAAPEWIPISKGLPKPYNDVYLTICANSAYYGFNKNFMKVKCGQYQPQDDKRDWLVDGVRYYFDNVIAWMSYQVPEPYRADREEVSDEEEEDDCTDIYCENCRNNYNCIEYLEEQERMNEEDDE